MMETLRRKTKQEEPRPKTKLEREDKERFERMHQEDKARFAKEEKVYMEKLRQRVNQKEQPQQSAPAPGQSQSMVGSTF